MRIKQFRFVTVLMLVLTTLNIQAATLQSGETELVVSDQSITIKKHRKTLMRIEQIQFNYEPLKQWSVISRNNTLVLTTSMSASVDVNHSATDTQQRSLELVISKIEGGFRLHAAPAWGRQVTLITDYLQDHFFGLSSPLQPDNQLSPDLTSTTIDVEIESEASLQDSYASAYSAFYISSLGYGAFFDTFARGRYQFNWNGKNRIHHDTGTLDWLIFTGDSGADIHRAYFNYIGSPKKVPAWALGPIGWTSQNQDQASEIIDEVKKISDLNIPFTAWLVDSPDEKKMPSNSDSNADIKLTDSAHWVNSLFDNYNLQSMTGESTTTAEDNRFGRHLNGKMNYLDLSDTKTVTAYQQYLKTQLHSAGIKGHQIDRGDEALPLYEEWSDNTPTSEKRNKYAWLMAKTYDEVLGKTWNDNQATIARAAIHRTQPHLTALRGGEPKATWDGLRGSFANATRAAFMGFPVWGTDVGGREGKEPIPENLYLRWLQAASMTGLFEIKLDNSQRVNTDSVPWRYSENFQQQFRAICNDRMTLLPYLYSLANTSAHNGPTMQPMAYRHLDDKETYAIWDQFYVGDAILVAPVFTASQKRNIYLPAGEWRDYDNSNLRFKGGKTVSFDAPLNKLPRFVKANSLFVTGNLYRGNDKLWREPGQLTIHAFPGAGSSATVFDYADINDKGRIKPITMKRKGNNIVITTLKMADAGQIEVLLEKPPKATYFNGKPAKTRFDAVPNKLIIEFEAGVPTLLSIEL